MKKLNSVIYNKLLLQAEEAKEIGMTKLASGILGSLGPLPEDEQVIYNFNELKNDVYHGLWKLATCVIKYHDVESLDAEKVNEVLKSLSSKMIEEIEQSIGIEDTQVGPLEDKVIGQIK